MRNKLFGILFMLNIFNGLNASSKLTIFAIVDGMDTQSLQDLRSCWPLGGFRTLSEEAFQTTVVFPQIVYGGDETTATLLTGVTPFFHGYTADSYFARTDRSIHPMLLDEQQRGINTRETISPAGIPCATISDHHRLHEGNKAKIYAIGIQPSTTVLLAGHSANACCWIEHNGWGATAYYGEGLPAAADKMNVRGTYQEIAERTWNNRLDIASYLRPTDLEKKKNGFTYQCTKVLRHSTAANSLVINLALEMQKAEKLGERGQNDLLLLNLTVVSPKTNTSRIASAEQEDMYLSLNQDLGFLLEQLQKHIKKEDIQLILVGKPCYGDDIKTLQAIGLPFIRFNIDRAAALVGTYLMAIYGHERWVDGGFGNSIYLNKTLIEQKKLPLETIRHQVADFLREMEGVQAAYSITDIPLLQGGGEFEKLRNSIGKNSGDVVVMLAGGVMLMINDQVEMDQVIQQDPEVPLLMWSGAHHAFPELQTPLPATEVYKLIK